MGTSEYANMCMPTYMPVDVFNCTMVYENLI